MAKLPGSFRADQVEGRMGEFSAIPAGEYRAKIKDSSRTPTKKTLELPKAAQSKGVHYYKLTIEITEGQYKGRLIFVNLNLEHEKENVVEMAEKELASICDACNKVSVEKTEDLHNIEFMIKVGIKAATSEFPESNVIRAYSPLKGVKKPTLGAKKETAEPADEPVKQEVKKPARKVSF